MEPLHISEESTENNVHLFGYRILTTNSIYNSPITPFVS